jgi:ABC-type transport system involved in multi-copper enzyme maturation permease subunit
MTAFRPLIVQALRGLARDRTVAVMAALFVVLVLISAWLGWSATTTVNAIYADAATFLAASGQPVPPNPVLETSPLALLRNLSIYVSLIGALAASVTGFRLVATDRRAGVLPLIGSRPLDAWTYAASRLVSLALAMAALIALAAAVSVMTFLILPGLVVTGADWLRLTLFFVLSWGFVMLFGLIALGATATARSEAAGLLTPVSVWLAVTFILPALTGNIHPTAAINPVSALAAAPDRPFFHVMGTLFGPLSLAESFKFIAADLLRFLPDGILSRGTVPPLPALFLALAVAFAFALRGLSRLDLTKGDFDA